MSRQQYKALPRPDSAPAGFLFPWQGASSATVYTRNSGHALTHARRPRARLNRQFKYGSKQFQDSVDSLPARQQPFIPLDAASSVEGDDYSAAPSDITEDTAQMYRVDYKLTEDPASLFYNPPEKQKQQPAAVDGGGGGFGFGFGKASSVLSMRRPQSSGGYKSSSVVPVNNAFDASTQVKGATAFSMTVTAAVRPHTAGPASTVAGSMTGGGRNAQSAAFGNRSVVSGRHTANFTETASVMGYSLSWAPGTGVGGIAMPADYMTVDGGQSMSFIEGEDSRILQQNSQSQLGWQSDDAVRSNYLSVQSTNPGILVPVKMQRYRKMRKIDTRRVKGGFHLISKDSKERKLDERRKFVKQRLKEINEGLL